MRKVSRLDKKRETMLKGNRAGESVRNLGSISPTCLREAFTHADPKSFKKTDDLTVFFALLGSAHVKALCKMLMKLTPDESVGNVMIEFVSYFFRRLLQNVSRILTKGQLLKCVGTF
jgi:hypothetical protein